MKKQPLIISIIILAAIIVLGFWFVKKDHRNQIGPTTEMPILSPVQPRALTEEEKQIETEALARIEKAEAFWKGYYKQDECCFAMSKPIDKNFLVFNFVPHKVYDNDNNLVPDSYKDIDQDNLTQISELEYSQAIDTSVDFKPTSSISGNVLKENDCLKFTFGNGWSKSLCNDPEGYVGFEYVGFSEDLNSHLIEEGGFEYTVHRLISQYDGTEILLNDNGLHKYSADKKYLISYSNTRCDYCGPTGISFFQLPIKDGNYNPYGGYLGDGYAGAWGVIEVKIDNQNIVYFKTQANWNTYTDKEVPTANGKGYYRDFDKTYSYFKQIIK